MVARHVSHPVQTLVTVFLAWKALLLVIAAGTRVGTAYDTSSSLLPEDRLGQSQSSLVTRLTSWDALFFVHISRHGYRFEQEWAFAYGFPSVILLWKRLGSLFWERDSLSEAVLGVGAAHVSHLLSVLVLYRLGILVWRDRRVAFVGACLHVFSPAGIFLSAPYSESTFALLSFAGYFLYAKGCYAREPTARSDAWQLLAGAVFGVATVFRSNGIFNGLPFAYEAAQELVRFLRSPDRVTFRRLIFLGVGGLCVGAGLVVPQLVAYQRYCSGLSGASPRPWCARVFPSIYTYVQELYWGVGFFHYWEPAQIPMFAMAAPMTVVLVKAGADFLREGPSSVGSTGSAGSEPPPRGDRLTSLLRSMAASQVILALLAVTNYHVQIITRLASAYPVWYWWLARSLAGQQRSRGASGIVVFMVMYASIQGALFAFFLPPA